MSAILLEVAQQAPRVVKLIRPLTTIGSSKESDIQVEGAGLEPTHVQITQEGDRFVVTALLRDMTVNSRREKRRPLEDRDIVRFGDDVRFIFYRDDAEVPRVKALSLAGGATRATAANPVESVAARLGGQTQATSHSTISEEIIAAYRRIHEFSVKLLANESTEALIESILDSIIELTRADKGFLVLLDENGRPVVRAARNIHRTNLQQSLDQLSDSILRKVIETKKPLVISDALQNTEFNASESIVALNILSVMCCPLLDNDQLKGLLYVGNNQLTHVFDSAALEVLTVFAAEASLLLGQARRVEELMRAKQALQAKIEDRRFGSILGASEAMKEVFKRLRKVATTDVPVLITGETGTGKELIAKEIHEASRRASGPFVVINCGAIPGNLLESELFGHVRGAFTGAVSAKQGRFQAANGGTLFLDEIGEMPLGLQVKILRALQEHVVTRVGDTRDEQVDIRVLAATNRVLEEEIKAGRFREDLYYRLNVVNILLPPLRERYEDIDLLARFFLDKSVAEHERRVKGFTKSCLDAMKRYRWPGNIRELQNRINKAVVLADETHITEDDLELRPEDFEEILPLAEAKERFQATYINRVLEINGGNRTKTAKDLGVDPRTIFRHLEKMQNPSSSGDTDSPSSFDQDES